MGREFDAFLVEQTTDDRGTRGAVVGYYTLKPNAEEAAKGHGWFGGVGSVTPVKMVEIDNRCYPVMKGHESGVGRAFLNANLLDRERDIRTKAWEKVGSVLNAEEMKLLGIKAPA